MIRTSWIKLIILRISSVADLYQLVGVFSSRKRQSNTILWLWFDILFFSFCIRVRIREADQLKFMFASFIGLKRILVMSNSYRPKLCLNNAGWLVRHEEGNKLGSQLIMQLPSLLLFFSGPCKILSYFYKVWCHAALKFDVWTGWQPTSYIHQTSCRLLVERSRGWKTEQT